MSIERSAPSVNTPSTSRNEDGDRGAATATREPPSREYVDRFRSLMQAREEAQAKNDTQAKRGQAAGEKAQASETGREPESLESLRPLHRRNDDGGNHRQHADILPSADNPVLLQAQLAAQPATMANTTVPLPANPNAFAALLERHVRQLAVSAGGATRNDGQVLLRLADSTLPGTDLLLSRTADGWLLRADVRSRGSFDAIRDAAPTLAKRFAERNLGTLTIDPHYHG